MKTKTQKIPRTALLEISKTVCDSWKTIILEHLALQTTKDIIVNNDLIDKAYSAANDDQKKTLDKYFKREIPKSIIDEIKTLKDIYRLTKTKEKDVILFPKPKNKIERYLNACSLLPLIAQAYNNGTTLDWNNTSVYKYFPYKNFYGGSCLVHFSSWSSTLNCPVVVYYKSENAAKDAYSKFSEVFEDFWGMK